MPLPLWADHFHPPKPCLYNTIIPFYQSVCTWVTRGNAGLPDPHLITIDLEAPKVFPATVRADARRRPVPARDGGVEPLGYPATVQRPLNYPYFYPLTKITNTHH